MYKKIVINDIKTTLQIINYLLEYKRKAWVRVNPSSPGIGGNVNGIAKKRSQT